METGSPPPVWTLCCCNHGNHLGKPCCNYVTMLECYNTMLQQHDKVYGYACILWSQQLFNSKFWLRPLIWSMFGDQQEGDVRQRWRFLRGPSGRAASGCGGLSAAGQPPTRLPQGRSDLQAVFVDLKQTAGLLNEFICRFLKNNEPN